MYNLGQSKRLIIPFLKMILFLTLKFIISYLLIKLIRASDFEVINIDIIYIEFRIGENKHLYLLCNTNYIYSLYINLITSCCLTILT